MKLTFPHLAILILLILLLAGCNLPNGNVTTPDNGIVATKAALTLVALTQSAQLTPLASPTSHSSPTSIPSTTTQTPTLNPTNTTGPSPTQTPTLHPTNTTAPTNTPIPPPGSIAGNILGYPYGFVPGLAIVAYGQEKPYYYSYLITSVGTIYYDMSSNYLIPGHFQVVAYDSSGHTGGCTILVLVISNQTVQCDITNWGGGYPPKPSGVPSP